MNTYRYAGVALSALSVLSFTACGGGSGAGTDKEIKVGVSAALSGPIASVGFAQTCGFKAYMEGRNTEGGANGFTVKVEEKDNQYDPATAASIARDFATGGETFAVFVSGSGTSQASRDVLKARNVPMFATGDGALYTPPKWEAEFGYYPDYGREAASAVDFIKTELGESEASHVYFGAGVGDHMAAAFKERTSSQGVKLLHGEGVAPSSTDFAPVAQKLKAAGAPVVYTQLVDTQTASLQKAAAAIGYRPKWVMWNIAYGSSYLSLAGDLAVDSYVSTWAWPGTYENDETKQYVADMEALGGKCADQVAESNAATGYGVAAALYHGIEKATAGGEKPAVEEFLKHMEFENQTLGTTPDARYTEESHSAVQKNSYWQITSTSNGGQLKLVRDFAPLPE